MGGVYENTYFYRLKNIFRMAHRSHIVLVLKTKPRDFSGNNLLTVLENGLDAIRNRAFAEFIGWDAVHVVDIVDCATGEVVDQIEN
jgi:hypothetical protein